jgi:acetolactate decarboxylase
MVGFRAPSYVGRISPPRYHLHFVSRDRSYGGHVLAFTGCEAEIAFEQIERQEILYPTTPDFSRKRLI